MTGSPGTSLRSPLFPERRDVGSTCPRAIGCPECGAGTGGACVRPSGHRAMAMHAARVVEAEAIDAATGELMREGHLIAQAHMARTT